MSDAPQRWWASLAHGGLLITPTALTRHFADPAPALSVHLAERLRRDVVRAGDDITPLLDTVLGGVLGLDGTGGGRWLAGASLGTEWSHAALTRETIRPRRVWICGDVALPVFIPSDHPPRIGVGRGRQAVARVIEWLRRSGRPIALLTNGRQWRLMWAGPEADAWAEWDTSLWFLEGIPGDQVTALRTLLGSAALTPPTIGGPPELFAAIGESRRGQAELSDALGEQVREAVETLIRACGPSIDALGSGVDERDVYIAATRVVMRLVVVLFAEARELLPSDMPVYHGSYGIAGLRDELDRAGGSVDRLRNRHGAWGRVLGLFRLIHDGSAHEALPVQRYGGELFAPGSQSGTDPISRAVAAFESLSDPPNDAVIARILHLLTRTAAVVRQGRGALRVEVPVDFSDLSTEYLGILYEGLLDYELRTAPPTDPVVFLARGDQPALPLSRLEGLDDPTLASLVQIRRVPHVESGNDDAGVDREETGPDEEELESLDDDIAAEDDVSSLRVTGEEPVDDALLDARDERARADARAVAWGRRAVTVAKLVPATRGNSAPAAAARDVAIAEAARALVARVVLPGERYLVRWGGTRKGAGTFYTPPALAVPTVERTLRPLAYEPPHGDRNAPPETWVPRTPEIILSLRVCDPAMGSASFLVAAVRFLTDALFFSLHTHGRIDAHGSGTQITLAAGAPHDGLLSRDSLPVPPDADDFEPRLRSRLKRYIVETCIYGVDIDPLAVELGRIALWIETMDEQLPFEFLDHRLRIGNSLIGCWHDHVLDYPLLAWDRKAGDEDQATLVHHRRRNWSATLTAVREEVRADIVATVTGQTEAFRDGRLDEVKAAHDDAVRVLTEMAALPVHDADVRAVMWHERFLGDSRQAHVHETFDTWCALWFWPADEIRSAPRPSRLHTIDDEQRAVIRQLRNVLRFFHWELEFPDVFTADRRGFDAVVGNPPWETAKPNSKEFFSNIDPLYRAYGKQTALRRQHVLFAEAPDVEEQWLRYIARFKAQSNWVKHVARPFGDGRGGGGKFALARGSENVALHRLWSSQRTATGLADEEHPFRHQGSADLNSFKLFLELGHAVLRPGGRLGFIVPSGLYSDRGTSDLRDLFLDRCRWEWLFAFENHEGIFDIHRSFKFGPVILEKAGTTDAVRTAFMRRDARDWDQAETIAMSYSRAQIERFSRWTRAFLEVGNRRDLDVLERVYASSVLLGDDSTDGWGVSYATEFHMTNDSKRFPPRSEWDLERYHPDEYGRLIGPSGEVILPFYTGRMVNQYDFSENAWLSGRGRRAKWERVGYPKSFGPEYLMSEATFRERTPECSSLRLGFVDIATAVHFRTMLAALLPDYPAGNGVPLLRADRRLLPALCAFLNSWPFDFAARRRIGYLHLNYYVIAELPLPQPGSYGMARHAMALAAGHPAFASAWWDLLADGVLKARDGYSSIWAWTRHERLRLRVMLDAAAATLYGIDALDLRWILKDTDLSIDDLRLRAERLDQKGFWRMDQDAPPELRASVLTMVAFDQLQGMVEANGGSKVAAVESFLALNNGEGWMLPETVRLADYDLGHDDRARHPQPVVERLGPRWLPWQEAMTPEEGWLECERHARALLGDDGVSRFRAGGSDAESVPAHPTHADGRPEQESLFPQPRQGKLFQ